MDEKQIVKLLRQMGDEYRSRILTDEQREKSWKRVALAIGANPDAPRKNISRKEYAEFFWRQFKINALRPIAVGAVAFVVLLGGWSGMVNASFGAVPGDVLYPVKIASEQAQLALTFGDEDKAKLHVEFASRRLQEVTAIALLPDGEKSDQAKTAIDGFTREIEAVNSHIETIKATDLSAASAIAKIVDMRVDEYQSIIEQTEQALPEETAASVDSALEVVDAANTQAVAVMVEQVEATQETTTAADLQSSFQGELASILSRNSYAVNRIAAAERVLGTVELEGESALWQTLNGAHDTLNDSEALLSEAMDTLAAGGYTFSSVSRVLGFGEKSLFLIFHCPTNWPMPWLSRLWRAVVERWDQRRSDSKLIL